ncbi:TRAF3-interacting protein 1, partial [Ophiophagus hannah]
MPSFQVPPGLRFSRSNDQLAPPLPSQESPQGPSGSQVSVGRPPGSKNGVCGGGHQGGKEGRKEGKEMKKEIERKRERGREGRKEGGKEGRKERERERNRKREGGKGERKREGNMDGRMDRGREGEKKEREEGPQIWALDTASEDALKQHSNPGLERTSEVILSNPLSPAGDIWVILVPHPVT